MQTAFRRFAALAAAVLTLVIAAGVPSAGSSTAAATVEVLVEVEAGAGPGAAVRRAGGQLEGTYARLATAYVTPAERAELERDPAVLDVRPPLRPVQDAISEGVVASNANEWHARGFTGQGVKVAVIDSSFNGSLGVTPFGCAKPNATSHGTAVAYIVQEMAPNATMLRYCVDDEPGLGQAVLQAMNSRVDVIVQSLSWFNGSRGDSQPAPSGSPDALAAVARTNGILWVNSAGNFSQRHWSGSVGDADSDDWMEFAQGDEGNSLRIPPGGEVCVYLKWDSWPRTAQNYDLHLWLQMGSSPQDQVGRNTPDPSKTPRQGSTGGQSGVEPPTEQLCYTNRKETAEDAFIAIRRIGATQTNMRFDLFITAYDLQYQTAAGSVAEPATSPVVLSVGAACWQGSQVEWYSSRGPTIDGRPKPDLVGPDSVTSPFPEFGSYTGCGTSGFRGSSAAAPHVAGAAALVLGRNPGWTPAQVKDYLEGSARDLAPAGKDSVSGAGMLRLAGFTPPPPPPPPPAPPPPKLRMLIFQMLPSQLRAGHAFRARAVISSDGELLNKGKVACPTKLAGVKLRPRSARFRSGFAECRWSVPRSAAGKLLRGSLGVTYKRGSVRRVFKQRVLQSRG